MDSLRIEPEDTAYWREQQERYGENIPRSTLHWTKGGVALSFGQLVVGCLALLLTPPVANVPAPKHTTTAETSVRPEAAFKLLPVEIGVDVQSPLHALPSTGNEGGAASETNVDSSPLRHATEAATPRLEKKNRYDVVPVNMDAFVAEKEKEMNKRQLESTRRLLLPRQLPGQSRIILPFDGA